MRKTGFLLLLTAGILLLSALPASAGSIGSVLGPGRSAAGAQTEEAPDPNVITPVEITEDVLLETAQNLIYQISAKSKFLAIYTQDPEIKNLVLNAARYLLFTSYVQKNILDIDSQALLENWLKENGDDSLKYASASELLKALGNHAADRLFSSANAMVGTSAVAASAILTVETSFVGELDHEIVLLMEFGGNYSLAVDVYPSGEHVVTAVAQPVYTQMMPFLLEQLQQ